MAASFETGAVKIRRNREEGLRTLEKRALRNVLRYSGADSNTVEQ